MDSARLRLKRWPSSYRKKTETRKDSSAFGYFLRAWASILFHRKTKLTPVSLLVTTKKPQSRDSEKSRWWACAFLPRCPGIEHVSPFTGFCCPSFVWAWSQNHSQGDLWAGTGLDRSRWPAKLLFTYSRQLRFTDSPIRLLLIFLYVYCSVRCCRSRVNSVGYSHSVY